MKNKRIYISVFFCWIFVVFVQNAAVSQQNISFTSIPANNVHVSDLCNISITLTNKDTLIATLDFTITNQEGMMQYQIHTTPFIILPKKSANFKFGQNQVIVDYSIDSNTKDLQKKLLIPANYFVCAMLNVSDSAKTVYTECKEIVVTDQSKIIIVKPQDKYITNSAFIEFKWNKPVVPGCNNFIYGFRLSQIDTNQTVKEALDYNPNIYSTKKVLSNEIFINKYTINLKSPARYAWQVIAFNKEAIVSVSVPREFIYDSTGILSGMLDSVNYSGIKEKLKSLVSVPDIKGKTKFPKLLNLRSLKNTFSLGNDLSLNTYRKSKPISLYGYGKVEWLSSTRNDSIYQMAANFGFIDFHPTIALYGLPFVLDIYYSTDKSRSSINRFNVSFDYNGYVNNLQRKYETKKDYLTGLYNDMGSTNIDNLSSDLSSDYSSLTKLNEYLKRKDLFSDYDNINLGKYEDLSKLNVFRDIKLLDNLDMPQIGGNSDSVLKSKFGNDYQKISDLYELSQYINGNPNEIDMRKYEDSLRTYYPEKYELWKDLKKYSKYSNLTTYGKDSASSLISNNSYLTKFEKIISGVREFELGKTYPSFSELTLQGISFTGLNFAYFYKPVYFAVIYGKANDQYSYFSNFTSGIKRNVTGVKIGIGDKEFSHFHISFFRSDDDAIPIISDSIVIYPQLHQNYVISGELKIKYKERFCVISEYARSLLYSFYDTSSMNENSNSSWVNNMFVRQKTQFANSAFIVKGNFNLTETNTYLFGYVRRVDPNYNTLFVPFLKKDNILYDFRIDQKLLKNKLTLSVFMKNNHDNLSNWKAITTTYTYIGIKVSFKYKQKLSGSISYSPIVQQNDAENPSLAIKNKISNYSANLTWYKNFTKAKSIASFGFSAQQFRSKNSINDYSIIIIMVNEVLNFKKRLSLNFHFDYIMPDAKNDSSTNYSILLSASYKIGKKIYLTAGSFSRLSQEITSITSSIILTYRLSKYFDFNFRVEEQYLINEIINSKTNNWLGSFGISMQM